MCNMETKPVKKNDEQNWHFVHLLKAKLGLHVPNMSPYAKLPLTLKAQNPKLQQSTFYVFTFIIRRK